jgi:hypothetical protein
MLIVACAGLVINIVMYFILHGGSSHSHGLMSDSCDHDHNDKHDHDNKRKNSGDTTNDFCADICDDEICLKVINYNHCHKG